MEYDIIEIKQEDEEVSTLVPNKAKTDEAQATTCFNNGAQEEEEEYTCSPLNIIPQVCIGEDRISDLSDFQRGQIVGAWLVGTSVSKTAEMFNVSEATVSSAIMKHSETPPAKRKRELNPKVIDGDRTTLKRIWPYNIELPLPHSLE